MEEELNVKEVLFKEDMAEYLEYQVKPNFQILGKALGLKIKELQQVLSKLTSQEISEISEKGLKVKLAGEDFVITDHIKVYYNGTDKVEKMFDLYKDYIMGEVLGDELIKDISLKNKYELNDEVAYIDVEKIK